VRDECATVRGSTNCACETVVESRTTRDTLHIVALGPPKIDLIDKLSFPFFALCIGAEYLALRNREHRTLGDLADANTETLSSCTLPADPLVPMGFERRDSLASLSMLAGNVAVQLAMQPALTKVDAMLYRHRIASLGGRRGSLTAAMVLWDFCYYWDHRWMHEVRLLWANHVSHHSSERYNLTTALRQPWSPFLTFWVFAPLPFLGFEPAEVHRAGQLNLLYQFWIHTEAIDRLPDPIELLFNTPSHHRVHHGANRQYLDKNYGGILIVWDRLFGTFEAEVRRIRYGLTKNINTFNPAKIGYHEFTDIVRDVRSAKGWRTRTRYVVGRPGWQPTP
jgi:sterol desaturase/sphingolipid hydroxylase (fatty acid hydroxylase superfamily)